MKQLLNTLFVTSEDIYLSLEGENVLANRDKTVVARYPLHTLQAIVSFSYAGASPALMGKCAETGIGLAFCSPHGRFLARTCGESSGNVLLRREQYRIADDPARSCEIARTMIFGKLSNGAASIQRTLRDHAPRVVDCGLEKAAANLRAMLPQVLAAADLDSLRGIEGAAATAYFPQKTQKFYLFVKDPQVKLCIFAVAPPRGGRGLKYFFYDAYLLHKQAASRSRQTGAFPGDG